MKNISVMEALINLVREDDDSMFDTYLADGEQLIDSKNFSKGIVAF